MDISKYNIRRLDEIADIQLSGIDKKTKDGQDIVRLCNFTDVYHNWAITAAMHDELMVASASDSEIERFKLHKGQVAITKDSETKDDIGIAAYIADDFDDVVLGYHCALITPDESVIKGKYLNAFLHSAMGLKHFENQASGSGQRYTLTADAIGCMNVVFPKDIKIQEKIGDFFSNIDMKIANNNSVISELEAMAKEIYDYWFVQFDFPDENGKPYKSSGGKMVWCEELNREIPEGWTSDKIDNLLGDYPKTQSILRDDYGLGHKYPIIDQSKEYICGYTNDDSKILHLSSAIVFGDHTNIAKYVNFDFARGADGTQIINSNNAALTNYMLYLQIKELPVIEQGYSRHYKFLKEQCVLIPQKIYADKYNELIDPYLQKIRCNIEENYQLTMLRDYLLPLLMNGQVTISDQGGA